MSLTSRGLSKPKLSSRFEKRLNWHGIAGQRNRSIEKGHPSNRESAWVSCNVLSFYEIFRNKYKDRQRATIDLIVGELDSAVEDLELGEVTNCRIVSPEQIYSER